MNMKKHKCLLAQYYNAKLAIRQHEYHCSLKNCSSEVKYETLWSKENNDIKVDITGLKSGEQKEYSGGIVSYYRTINTHKAPHAVIRVQIRENLLLHEVSTYPCIDPLCYCGIHELNESRYVAFIFHDFDALKYTFERVKGDHSSLIAFCCTIFTDWENIDYKTAKGSASTIQRYALQKIYSPKGRFYINKAESIDYFSYSQELYSQELFQEVMQG